MKLLSSLLLFRHGQRPPYPARFDISAEGASIWSTKPFPSRNEWAMQQSDFDSQRLTPHGKRLLRHLGEYVRSTFPLGDPCKVPSFIAADVEPRDIQSAQAFTDGLFHDCSAAAVVNVANGSLAPLLRPIASDHFDTGCGPTKADAPLAYGGNAAALTSLYKHEIDLVRFYCNAVRCHALPFAIAAPH